MTKNLIVLLIIFIANSAGAQTGFGFVKGTIVSKQGDTLICLVERALDYSDKVFYKMQENDEVSKMKVKDIKSLKTPVAEYENIPIDKKEKLMLLKSKGKINLYSFTSAGESKRTTIAGYGMSQSTFDFNYVIKKKDRIQLLTKENFKQAFLEFTKDCAALVTEINSSSYNLNDINTILTDYENCGK